MSRSYRKTPIFGFCGSRSEASDKKEWHKRWRTHQRNQLATITLQNCEILPIHEKSVSNPWKMSKDGKHWFGLYQQEKVAGSIATRRCGLPTPIQALQVRLLAKWRAK